MLYCYIQNITGQSVPRHNGEPVPRMLTRPDGTADYHVAVQLNTLQLAAFEIKNFPRKAGWAKLLERIGQEGQQHDAKGNAWFQAVVAAEEEIRVRSKKVPRARKQVVPKGS